jgi:hypothetical protein
MQIDLKALDQKIKELQLFRRMLSNPENTSLLGSNTANEIRRTFPTRQAVEHRGVRYDVLSFLPNSVPDSGASATPLTAREILSKMQAAKYKFSSKDPLGTIQTALRELARKGLVERAGIREDTGAVLWRKS